MLLSTYNALAEFMERTRAVRPYLHTGMVEGVNLAPDESPTEEGECGFCGQLHPVHHLWDEWEDLDEEVSGYLITPEGPVCRHCVSSVYIEECYGCADRMATHPRHTTPRIMTFNDMPLCNNCGYDALTCERCGRAMLEHDARWSYDDLAYCDHCWIHSDNAVIKDYHCNDKTQRLFGDSQYRFGFELEVANGTSDYCPESMAKLLVDTIQWPEKYLFHEYDSTVSEGWELITAPQDYKFWREVTRPLWHEALELLRKKGYRSHDARSCGLHIHVGLTVFGECQVEREATLTKAVYLYEKFWDDMSKLSRRNNRQLTSNAERYGVTGIQDAEMLVKEKGNYRKYAAINMSPGQTCEFRIFRGTLLPESLDAAIDFTVGFVEGIASRSLKEIRQVENIMDVIPDEYKTEELMAYAERRGILGGECEEEYSGVDA